MRAFNILLSIILLFAISVPTVSASQIIGYNTKGSLSVGVTGATLWSLSPHHVATINGEVTSLSMYASAAVGGDTVIIAVYEADNSTPFEMFDPGGSLYPLVAYGSGVTVGSPGITTFTPTIVKSIVAGQTYRVAFFSPSALGVNYNNLVAYSYAGRATAYVNPPPDPSGISTTSSSLPWTFSVWAEYAEASSTSVRTHLGYPNMVF